ncbi:hypothetical protein [Qipengyuania nanhaisediminis]|uniref:Uncharacterized protein n=1 Tax=Qipengyuania nanhaisediminis TaxID=604088 RepID=A0A1I5NXU3_9SPHN|nr:hypothetical protein [Qipengyuania nanhaisediminis]SFP26440.1 hypothetical protein SAMN04488060_2160 [Qipengyuania nanhaisediminis]
MAKLTIRDRITRHFDEFDHQWNTEFNRSKADLSSKGLTGSSVMIKSGFTTFEAELQKMLSRLLSEIAHVIRHRGRRWRDAHTQVREALVSRYPDIANIVGGQLGTRPVFDYDVWAQLGVDIKNAAIDVIDAHEDGYTSPKPEPIAVRHPIGYAALCGALGLFGGGLVSVFGPDIRAVTLDFFDIENQSSSGSQSKSDAPEFNRLEVTPAA